MFSSMLASVAGSTSELTDEALIEQVCNRLEDRYGQAVPICDLPAVEQTVLLVATVKGVIDNGGFRYLFEAPLVGDPHYELALASFERIGALTCVLALRRAFNFFSERRPPRDDDERLEAFLAIPEPRREALDELFLQQRNVWALLAEYIRANATVLSPSTEPGDA